MSEETTTSYTWEDYNEWRQKNLALQAELDKHRWIPVSEGLPKVPVGPPNENSETVWIIFKGIPCNGYYTNFEGWRVYGMRFQKRMNQKDITHWMHIHLPDDQEASDAQS